MIVALQRYKLVLVIISLIISALMVWFMISRLNTHNIPSRGVFVIGKVMK